MAALAILHVTPYYEEAWAYGGIPRVVTALTRGLGRLGHRVTVATTDACDARGRLPRGPRRQPEEGTTGDPGPGVAVRVFPNLSNGLAYRRQLFLPLGLGRYLRQHAARFDVAHLHGCHHLPGAIAAGHLRRAGVPYVLTPNGTGPRIERRRLAKGVFDATLGRGVLGGAARVLAVSDAERRQLVALGVAPGRIGVVPNPVDLSELAVPPERGWLRGQLGLGSGPLVVYLGTLTPRKRVDLVVAAIARLRRPDVRLVIAGNDLGAGPAIRRLVRRLGLGPVTAFTGLLRGRDRLRALADADVVAYPGRDEVFGLVALEAILCGRPVIVSDDCGAAEVIRQVGGGLAVAQGGPDALAAAIGHVLETPGAWTGPVAAAAARIRERYAAPVVCQAITGVYRALAPRGAADAMGA